jgi:hypothetical protein
VTLVGRSEVIHAGSVSEAGQVNFGNESPYYAGMEDLYWTATFSSDLNTMTGTCARGCSSMMAVRQ